MSKRPPSSPLFRNFSNRPAKAMYVPASSPNSKMECNNNINNINNNDDDDECCYCHTCDYTDSEIIYFESMIADLGPQASNIDWAKVAASTELPSEGLTIDDFLVFVEKGGYFSRLENFSSEGDSGARPGIRRTQSMPSFGVHPSRPLPPLQPVPQPEPQQKPVVDSKPTEIGDEIGDDIGSLAMVEEFVRRNPDIDLKIEADDDEDNEGVFSMELKRR